VLWKECGVKGGRKKCPERGSVFKERNVVSYGRQKKSPDRESVSRERRTVAMEGKKPLERRSDTRVKRNGGN
jgi:hypothetical protein